MTWGFRKAISLMIVLSEFLFIAVAVLAARLSHINPVLDSHDPTTSFPQQPLFFRGDSDWNIDTSVRRWTRRTARYTPLLWRNLQRVVRNSIATVHPSFGTWYYCMSLVRRMAPKISSSKIGSSPLLINLTTSMNPYFAPFALSWTFSAHIGTWHPQR